jgi:tRNA C32,U32 (ribose-2'-O)-methylase TrmJ
MHSPALLAENTSPLTETGTASTAAMPAISQTVSKEESAMNKEQFQREKLYQASMQMFRMMLKQGLITSQEFTVISSKMQEKYRPLFGTLFSG